MIRTRHTEICRAVVAHVRVGAMRYPVALILETGRAPVAERDEAGRLLYATPGGGRKTAEQLAAA